MIGSQWPAPGTKPHTKPKEESSRGDWPWRSGLGPVPSSVTLPQDPLM